MKSTGIVRRVDDLGRVVIPREIRRALRIREGDPLEIFTSEEGITLKKYDCTKNIENAIIELETAVCQEDDIQNKSSLLQKVKELREILNMEKE